jgi:hypothetical protein
MVNHLANHSIGCGKHNMKMVYLAAATVTISALTGCAAYTVSSGVSIVVTGRSITDHAVTKVSGVDCDALRAIKETTWYCESTPDPGTRYNRNGI